MKLREGNVYSRICLSVHGEDRRSQYSKVPSTVAPLVQDPNPAQHFPPVQGPALTDLF